MITPPQPAVIMQFPGLAVWRPDHWLGGLPEHPAGMYRWGTKRH